MRYKPLALTFATLMTLFVALNYAVWKGYTEDLLTDNNYDGGDLARTWYIYDSKDFRKNICDLPRGHLQLKDYNIRDIGGKIDIITIGDSFSNGGAGGRNRFYQDYIASINNLKVLNICRHRDLDPVTTASILLNNGFFDRCKPRYLLISLTERGSGDELTQPLDFNKNISLEQLPRLKIIDYYSKRPYICFINDGNLKFVFYTMLYHFSDHSYLGERRIWKLKKPMFSVKNSDKLLSIKYKKMVTKNDMKIINDNLNILADRLKIKGITLVYMPCVDKLNLYGKFLVDRLYSESSFFEDLRVLSKHYIFIDTKVLLLEELEKGEKDIFYADDTHWSWKASEKIFKSVKFEK